MENKPSPSQEPGPASASSVLSAIVRLSNDFKMLGFDPPKEILLRSSRDGEQLKRMLLVSELMRHHSYDASFKGPIGFEGFSFRGINIWWPLVDED